MDTKYGTIAIIGGKGDRKVTLTNYLRCKDCEYLHENGNCLKYGGFYNSISNKICSKNN